MKLRLKDFVKDEDVLLDFKIDYSYKPSDMLVILSVYQTVCGLSGNNNTTPYDEHYFKKIQHIIKGTTTYSGYEHTITLGEYLHDNDLNYFLISDEGERYLNFQSPELEIPFKKFRLCDYGEYKESCEITGNEILSKRNFISLMLNDEVKWDSYGLFNTIAKQRDLNLFVNASGLSNFLDSEELRTNFNLPTSV